MMVVKGSAAVHRKRSRFTSGRGRQMVNGASGKRVQSGSTKASVLNVRTRRSLSALIDPPFFRLSHRRVGRADTVKCVRVDVTDGRFMFYTHTDTETKRERERATIVYGSPFVSYRGGDGGNGDGGETSNCVGRNNQGHILVLFQFRLSPSPSIVCLHAYRP
jgi:hypothetical protein